MSGKILTAYLVIFGLRSVTGEAAYLMGVV